MTHGMLVITWGETWVESKEGQKKETFCLRTSVEYS